MNNVILMGRPVRDPDIRYSESSMAVARFVLAVDRRYKKDTDEQNADFIRCVSFGKTAEIIEKYVSQGKKIVVQGRIQTGSYTNKDGAKIFTTDVVVEYMEFAESKSSEAYRPEPAGADGDGFMNIPDGIEDEGLPFT